MINCSSYVIATSVIISIGRDLPSSSTPFSLFSLQTRRRRRTANILRVGVSRSKRRIAAADYCRAGFRRVRPPSIRIFARPCHQGAPQSGLSFPSPPFRVCNSTSLGRRKRTAQCPASRRMLHKPRWAFDVTGRTKGTKDAQFQLIQNINMFVQTCLCLQFPTENRTT